MAVPYHHQFKKKVSFAKMTTITSLSSSSSDIQTCIRENWWQFPPQELACGRPLCHWVGGLHHHHHCHHPFHQHLICLPQKRKLSSASFDSENTKVNILCRYVSLMSSKSCNSKENFTWKIFWQPWIFYQWCLPLPYTKCNAMDQVNVVFWWFL